MWLGLGIGLFVGMCAGIMVAGLCSAAHNADVESELLEDAMRWQQLVNMLTARGWCYVTPVTIAALLPEVGNRFSTVTNPIEDAEMP